MYNHPSNSSETSASPSTSMNSPTLRQRNKFPQLSEVTRKSSPLTPAFVPSSETPCSRVAGLAILPSVCQSHRGIHSGCSTRTKSALFSSSNSFLSSQPHPCVKLGNGITPASPTKPSGGGRGLTESDLFHILHQLLDIDSCDFIDELRQLVTHIDHQTADFSQRFQMLAMSTSDELLIWFTCVDGVRFVFALSDSCTDKEVSFKFEDDCDSIPCIWMKKGVKAWTELQQDLVDRFKSDDHVRAVLVACMLSFNYQGKFTCVLDALLPSSLRRFHPVIEFDEPVDEDILTLLADPCMTDEGKLFFDCGGGKSCEAEFHNWKVFEQDGGVCAKVVPGKNQVYHLERMDRPSSQKPFEESIEKLMPYMYGFGMNLRGDEDDYSRTSEIGKLLQLLIRDGKKNNNVFEILKLATFASPQRNLDLTEAANMISKWEGGILPGTWAKRPWEIEEDGLRGSCQRAINKVKKYTRRFVGDVILIGHDGLYKSSRFDGCAIAAKASIDLAIFKLGLKVNKEIKAKDRKIKHLNEVAAYILEKDYVPFDNYNGNEVMVPRCNDRWDNEVAIANSLAALICRRFGMFKGFSSFASSSRYLCALFEDNVQPHMVADIYLPVLHVFVDPGRQLAMMRSAAFLLFLKLSIGIFLALLAHSYLLVLVYLLIAEVALFFFYWNSELLEEEVYWRCLRKLSSELRPRRRVVGLNRDVTLLIHDNPYATIPQGNEIIVFGHYGKYIDFSNRKRELLDYGRTRLDKLREKTIKHLVTTIAYLFHS